MRIRMPRVYGQGGPLNFAYSLGTEFLRQGHELIPPRELSCDINLNIISGPILPGCKNVLRLDGLYFDSEDTQTDEKNAPIFRSYQDHDHVIFQTEFSRLMYETHTKQVRPNTVIHNGASRLFKAGRQLDDVIFKPKMLIASSSWRRHKRLEEIVSAMTDLPDIGLIVMGGQDYWSGPVPDNVRMMPKVDQARLPAYYNSADAMVHIAWLDWCPNVVLEALCCGLPVLCNRNGGTHEVVDHGLFVHSEAEYDPASGDQVTLYNPPKANMLPSAIEEVLRKPKRTEIPDHLYIDSVCKKYLDVFNRLL
jgi:glycosyltransferase involved in cell wall biosynthesis